jgi:hypothetical protein
MLRSTYTVLDEEHKDGRPNTNQPGAELVVRPGAVDSVGSTVVVTLELGIKLVAVLLIIGLDDAMVDEPAML